MPKVFFHTFGCRVNQYETETVRDKLLKFGYKVSGDFASSDVCVINSCSVTAEADRKCRQFVRKVLRANPSGRVLVTGCYATRAPNDIRQISPRIEIFSNQEKDTIPQSLSGCSLGTDESSLLTYFAGRTRAFVKVQDGCDATCTYCIIPSLRPQMKSRPIEEVALEVRSLLNAGFKEIALTGIRLGSYGLTSSGGRVGRVHGNLADLLRTLVQIPHDYRIRLSSLEITEVTEEVLHIARDSEKICPHFHLPLQSGDDAMLRRMGRWYDSAYFEKQLDLIRKFLPHVGFTTDVITGFPGEQEEHFMNTHRFLEKHFHGLHVFPFSDRAGTSAVKLSGHNPKSVIEERVSRLIELDGRIREKFRARFAGTKRLVLAEPNGGFTDNGIRVPAPLPISEGEMDWITV